MRLVLILNFFSCCLEKFNLRCESIIYKEKQRKFCHSKALYLRIFPCLMFCWWTLSLINFIDFHWALLLFQKLEQLQQINDSWFVVHLRNRLSCLPSHFGSHLRHNNTRSVLQLKHSFNCLSWLLIASSHHGQSKEIHSGSSFWWRSQKRQLQTCGGGTAASEGGRFVLYHNRFQLTHLINESIFSEFLAEGLYFSVDPYMRPYSASLVNEGTIMIGSQVAK